MKLELEALQAWLLVLVLSSFEWAAVTRMCDTCRQVRGGQKCKVVDYGGSNEGLLPLGLIRHLWLSKQICNTAS